MADPWFPFKPTPESPQQEKTSFQLDVCGIALQSWYVEASHHNHAAETVFLNGQLPGTNKGLQ